MPLTGNRLGPRVKIVYESEKANTLYIVETDADLRVAGAGSGAGQADIYDPNSPPAPPAVISPPPKRFKPRVVFVQDPVSGARKEIVCAQTDANLYASTQRQTIAIDGLDFVTTGRRGEKLTF